jgi:hypothetical protein
MNSVALHDPHPKSQNYANNHTGIQPKIPDFPGIKHPLNLRRYDAQFLDQMDSHGLVY